MVLAPRPQQRERGKDHSPIASIKQRRDQRCLSRHPPQWATHLAAAQAFVGKAACRKDGGGRALSSSHSGGVGTCLGRRDRLDPCHLVGSSGAEWWGNGDWWWWWRQRRPPRSPSDLSGVATAGLSGIAVAMVGGRARDYSNPCPDLVGWRLAGGSADGGGGGDW